MNGRKLDETNNDIFIGDDGRVVRCLTLSESVMQNIRTVLQTFKGELFANPEVGTPWFQNILGKGVNFMDAVRDEIKDTILTVYGVSRVENLSLDVSGRNFSCSFSVLLIDGTLQSGEYEWQN